MTEEGKDKPETKSEEEDPIAKSNAEFTRKYGGLGKKPPTMVHVQRRLSKQGGQKYFDSGEYAKSHTNTEKKEIASLPHMMLRDKQVKKVPQRPSGLASPTAD